jgi:hypothetical protein
MTTTSREYAKFKRTFVGPVMPRKIRIAKAPAMPALRYPEQYKKKLSEIQQLATIKIPAKPTPSDRTIEATPAWADKDKIRMFYTVAKQMTINTGIPHEVDHIIPINHPLVCGLHVENNLRILTDEENLLKSNLFLIE